MPVFRTMATMNNRLIILNKCKGISVLIAQNMRISDCCFTRKFTPNVLAKNFNFPKLGPVPANVKQFRTWETNIQRKCIPYSQTCQTKTLTSFLAMRLYGLNIPESSLQRSSPFIFIQTRQKSGGRKRSRSSKNEMTDSDEEDETDAENEDEDEVDVDEDVPKGYKDITAHVKSLRVDSVLAAGLNISKSKIDDYFLQSKLRLNSEKVLKKARKVAEGDELDLIYENKDEVMKVKRVYVKKILTEKTGGDRFVVKLRTWRSPIEIEND